MSSEIIVRYDTVCLEDLNVTGMMHNSHLAKSIQSASWSEFVRMLEYKADRYGKNVIKIGRFEPSSKTCSCCGYVKSDLQLNEREWMCPHCGARHDRDVNAAVNIKHFALRNNGPQVSGLPDVEGSDTGLPVKRQDSKSERRLRH